MKCSLVAALAKFFTQQRDGEEENGPARIRFQIKYIFPMLGFNKLFPKQN